MFSQRDSEFPGSPEILNHRAKVAQARLNKNTDIIDLGFADLDIPPPRSVLDSLGTLLQEPFLHRYNSVCGLDELRELVAGYISAEHVEKIHPDRVFITAGANQAVMLAMLVTTNREDEVLVMEPYFFNHITQIQLIGCVPRIVPTRWDDQYTISAASLEREIGRRVRAVVLTNPRNPTATTLDQETFSLYERIINKKNRVLIVDESYREFVYDDKKSKIVASADTIRCGSFSKGFGLAGWRVGYLVVPSYLVNKVITAQDSLLIHPTVLSQVLAIKALQQNQEYTRSVRRTLNERRLVLVEGLRKCSFVESVISEAGTFVWVKLKSCVESGAFSQLLLDSTGVAVLKGGAFGNEGFNYVRIGFGCASIQDISTAVDRMSRFSF